MSSYRIQTAGLRDDVVATVKESKSVPLDAPQTQIEAEKSAILAEIAAIPPKLTSIKVFAFGDQFPSSTSSRNIKLKCYCTEFLCGEKKCFSVISPDIPFA